MNTRREFLREGALLGGGALFAGSLFGRPTRASASTASTGASLWSSKLVWAHTLPRTCLTLRSPDKDPFGECAPLSLAINSPSSSGEVLVSQAASYGITGLSVNIFQTPSNITEFLKAADAHGNFMIAPCIDLTLLVNSGATAQQMEDAIVSTLAGYAQIASGYSSPASELGAYLVFSYATGYLPSANWQNAQSRLTAQGVPTYWVMDNCGNMMTVDHFPQLAVTDSLQGFTAGYSFGDVGSYWSQLLSTYQQLGKQFGGGLMPGYTRETTTLAAQKFLDAAGTSTLRSRLGRHIAADLPWIHITSLNDFAEATLVMPSTTWNTTRSEIVAFFSAIHTGQPFPWSDPRLYITSPQSLHLGQGATFEALVLNPTAQTVSVKLDLLDGKGNVIATASGQAAPYSDGAASLVFSPQKLPASRFIRARGTMGPTVDSSSSLTHVGAPTIIYDAADHTNLKLFYHSVPAHRTLAKPALRLSSDPTKGRATAKVTPHAGTNVRFCEVLQNTRLVANLFNTGLSMPVPMANGRTLFSGQVINETAHGFYVGRITDTRGRVAYSDPVYVP